MHVKKVLQEGLKCQETAPKRIPAAFVPPELFRRNNAELAARKACRDTALATENPHLCPPPSQVQDLIWSSKADWMVYMYLAVITRFVAWHQEMHCTDGTLDGPAVLALFLAQECSWTKGKMEGAREALVWYFDLLGCQANLVRAPVELAMAQGAQQWAPLVVHH
uniref:Uncharacterized protein n=1 Tax=Plectus sambesii TaxID=2011161 RepID=A0A914WHE8_9BILA